MKREGLPLDAHGLPQFSVDDALHGAIDLNVVHGTTGGLRNAEPAATHDAQANEDAMSVEPEYLHSLPYDDIAADLPFLDSDEIMSTADDVHFSTALSAAEPMQDTIPAHPIDSEMFTSVTDDKLEQGEVRLRRGQKVSNTARLTLQKMCHVRGIPIFSAGGKPLTKKVLWKSLEDWVRGYHRPLYH